MRDDITRRELIERTALAAGLAALGGVWSESQARASQSPNEELAVASIACGGMGWSDLRSIAACPGVRIVALCDVDDARAAEAYQQYPDVPKYKDFRRMLDKEGKRIDAVHVSTPDHVHAVAASMAMKMGKHVYCQKPLTRTVSEARSLMLTARRMKVVTQMGTQGHPSYTRLVEVIESGAIGPVREVHVMTDRPIWPQGMDLPTDNPPVPASLDWDLWLGPARFRPYHPAYTHFVWRGWWDFGTGALGDMACHLMDGAFWALKLQYPTAVEAEGEPRLPHAAPKWSIIRYEFPARGDMPPVKLTWYDGGKMIPEEVLEGEKIDKGFNGSVFVGDRGKIFMGHGGEPKLLPEARFKDYEPPAPYLPRSPGHYQEWVNACRGNGTTASNFDYAAPMTESILLGNVAFRVGQKITYDAKRMSCPGCREADRYIRHSYRRGWKL
ncbi:MAG: Gfo/Idh/MocA family oxidoreductase [Chthonomonadales bacterium]|nr:Gfo/Idh/MocA family oxidoreductase [Chthonomonadales bacterium]